jgi:pre-mRNA-splicing factor ATP-dependent RNA helicase DHX38/PRP16
MAVIARAGSTLVKQIREKREAGKSRARFWEVAGSKMGTITGEAGKWCMFLVGGWDGWG